MKTIQLNVGLNNNPMSEDEVILRFAKMTAYRLMAYYIFDMTYEGETEPTFVALMEVMTDRNIINDVTNWCDEMTQECIAISCDNFETLVYNSNVTDKKYTFDKNLFQYVKQL
jgi:hypothetical protein